MVRPILRYGEPLLHDVAAPVAPDAVTAPSTRALIDDLLDTLRSAHGVGLAAPQVGIRKRICVVDVSGGQRPEDLLVLVNPAFEARDGLQLELEGCLSLPGFEATVWYGVYGPRKLPPRVLQHWTDAMNRYMRSEQAQTHLRRSFMIGSEGTPAAFAEFHNRETERWSAVVKAAGVEAQP